MKKHTKLFSITPEQVLAAYDHGMFPMARGRYGDIHWYISDPRAIVPLDDRFKVRRSLQKIAKKNPFRVAFDTDFPGVIRACARHTKVDSEEVWLSEEMIDLYTELYRRGVAHSVEIWNGNDLVGGLYGIAKKAAFFGESMFSRQPFSSQLALLSLVEHLRKQKFLLLDAQVMTPHLAQFGAIELSHEEYLKLLMVALREDRTF